MARFASLSLIVAACAAGASTVSARQSAVEFAVQAELQASQALAGKRCVRLGPDTGVDEREIVRDLRAKGFRLQNPRWCARHLTGIQVEVLSPVLEASPGVFQFAIAVGDMNIPPGVHFATLLKRGTYLVRSESGVFPVLVDYKPELNEPNAAQASTSTPSVLARIRESAMASHYGYQQLEYLCNGIGPRMAGSAQAAAAVEFVAQQFRAMGLTVSLEATPVPHWIRGAESAELVRYPDMAAGTTQKIVITALGGSVPTPPSGLTAKVVIVNDFGELKRLGRDGVAGRIVLFNAAFDQGLADRGFAREAYLQVVRYRVMGASKAAELGAVASLIRSIGPRGSRLVHTGSVRYTGKEKIPAAAISVEDADLITHLTAQGPVEMHLTLTPQVLPDTTSYNVIADLPGTTHPEQIVMVSAHLDSWDLGTGAIDNGAGVAAVLQVAHTMHELAIQPRATIRFVAWMNEENGGSGYTTYIEKHRAEFKHYLANIEIDNGTWHPVGYQAYATDKLLDKLSVLAPELALLGSSVVRKAPDMMGDLDEFMPGFGLLVDDRTYYAYHHTAADTFDKISEQGLREDAAILGLLAYAVADTAQQ